MGYRGCDIYAPRGIVRLHIPCDLIEKLRAPDGPFGPEVLEKTRELFKKAFGQEYRGTIVQLGGHRTGPVQPPWVMVLLSDGDGEMLEQFIDSLYENQIDAPSEA